MKANRPAIYYDFDGDGKMEFVMNQFQNIAKTAATFSTCRFNNPIGTGPNYAPPLLWESLALMILCKYPSAASGAVTAGTYASGLKHYLAEGTKAGLAAFAPFTKIKGSTWS